MRFVHWFVLYTIFPSHLSLRGIQNRFEKRPQCVYERELPLLANCNGAQRIDFTPNETKEVSFQKLSTPLKMNTQLWSLIFKDSSRWYESPIWETVSLRLLMSVEGDVYERELPSLANCNGVQRIDFTPNKTKEVSLQKLSTSLKMITQLWSLIFKDSSRWHESPIWETVSLRLLMSPEGERNSEMNPFFSICVWKVMLKHPKTTFFFKKI